MITPAVTIVIPVYNGEPYLATAIQSVIDQSYKNIEIIVIDDGSSDASAEIAARFGPAIKLIRQSNAGQSAALETAWRAASGTLLGYLSADDVLYPDAVEHLVGVLAAHPAIVLAYPDFDLIDSSGARTGNVTPPDYTQELQIAELHCLPGPGALFRKAAYDISGPWRRDMRQIPDLEFFFRLAALGDFIHVPHRLAAFRKNEASATYRRVESSRAAEPLILIAEHFDPARIKPPFRPYRTRAVANAFLLSAIIHAQSGRPQQSIKRIMSALATSPATLASSRGLAALAMTARSFVRSRGKA